MYASLLEEHQIEMKNFCRQLYIIQNYTPNVALKEFMHVFLLLLAISSRIRTSMYITAYICYIKLYAILCYVIFSKL